MITIENNGSKIVFFGRDNNGQLYIKKDNSFKPYFYILDEKGDYKSLFGEKCKKIYTESPKDVPKLRELYDKTFEADIIYTNRYLIDNFDEIPKEPLRICYFDMEIDV